MSSVRGSDGLPFTVTSRNVACSFDVQRAVSSPGTLIQGVATGRAGTTHGGAGDRPVIVRPSLDKYA